MQVEAALADGKHCGVTIEMDNDWRIQTNYAQDQVVLHLQAVLPNSDKELLYLFAASDPRHGAVTPLPPLASELLLYAPLVPLLKRPNNGFQALSWANWEAVVAEVGDVMPTSAGDSQALVNEDTADVSDDLGSDASVDAMSDADSLQPHNNNNDIQSDVSEDLSEDAEDISDFDDDDGGASN